MFQMQRILLTAGLIWALCLLGFFSARSMSSGLTSQQLPVARTTINDGLTTNTTSPAPASLSVPSSETLNDESFFALDMVSDDALSFAASRTGSASSNEAPETLRLQPASLPANPSPPASTDQVPNANADVRQQIQLAFPDADAETIDAWSETLQDLSSREIAEILMQKKALSGSLNSLLPPSLQTPSITTRLPTVPAYNSADTLSAVLMRNLQNAHCVGYRRLVLLPQPVTATPLSVDLQPATPEPGRFWSFQPGRSIHSPLPLHVSLGEDASLMFQLEGNILTRRGDFQLLPDRRIGLNTPSGFLAIANSPQLPPTAKRISINEQGRIQFHSDTDGTPGEAGVVSVVRIEHPDDLQSVDGVHFTSQSHDAWQALNPETLSLKTRQIELSNVDPASERMQLETLPLATGNSRELFPDLRGILPAP
jgi:hypothetical protein